MRLILAKYKLQTKSLFVWTKLKKGIFEMFFNVILIFVGFFLLIKGADLLVNGASGIAKKFHIPEIIIGLTIVSIGTSMPELFVSAKSAIEGHSDISIGNVIGSNLCNLLLILGLSAVIFPIKFQKETKFIELPMCISITIIYIVLCNIGGKISRIDSIIFLILFLIFIGYTVFMGIKGTKEQENEQNKEKEKNSIFYIIFIIIGIVALKFGGDFVVDNSEILAKHLGISEKIIGLTIIAIGTSLPELVTSVTAAIKKNSDIAIGNIIGSNIFNFLFITGLAGVIAPMNYSSSYNLQLGILLVSTIVLALFPYTDKKDEMTLSNGITYLMLYALYMVLLFVK